MHVHGQQAQEARWRRQGPGQRWEGARRVLSVPGAGRAASSRYRARDEPRPLGTGRGVGRVQPSAEGRGGSTRAARTCGGPFASRVMRAPRGAHLFAARIPGAHRLPPPPPSLPPTHPLPYQEPPFPPPPLCFGGGGAGRAGLAGYSWRAAQARIPHIRGDGSEGESVGGGRPPISMG